MDKKTWRFEMPFGAGYHVILDADGVYIASTWAGPNEEHARLMAAAPDLLEALQFCIQYDGGQCLGDYPARLSQARYAIAKATGEAA